MHTPCMTQSYSEHASSLVCILLVYMSDAFQHVPLHALLHKGREPACDQLQALPFTVQADSLLSEMTYQESW